MSKKTLTPASKLKRKIIDASLSIGDSDPENPVFQHSVLCQVGLPRAAVKGTDFLRQNGNQWLLIEAGSLSIGGKRVRQPVPYGTKPRLVLIHACTEAVRTKSPIVEVGNSVRGFLKMLNMDTSGRGFQLFRNQMQALAACHMTIGIENNTIKTDPVEQFEAWLTDDDGQQVMWPGVMELTPKFFDSLVEHAMPLDPRAISALKTSSLALDIYTFLANRLCRVRKRGGVKLSWSNLKDQFGQEYADRKDFKKAFKPALRRVLVVYPDAKVEEEIGGVRLRCSPPPIKRTSVVNLASI